VKGALDALTRLHQAHAPGWREEDDTKPSAAEVRDRPRLPRETIESCSPCPDRHEEGSNKLGGKYQDYDPQQCFDTGENLHSLAYTHPHDERCNESECIPWDGKSLFASSCFTATTIQTHSHHLDELKIQLKHPKGHTKEKSVSQHGMTSSATAMKNEHVMKTSSTFRLHSHIAMTKTGATLTQQQVLYSSPSGSKMQDTESESNLLETAVSNTVASLYENIHEFEEVEGENTRVDSKPSSNEADALLNIGRPTRPITHMIAHTIQGHRTRLPLKVLMDPGSDHSYIHSRVLPKGAVPSTVRARRTKTLSGIVNYDCKVDLKGILLKYSNALSQSIRQLRM
jgi:hypothetical protein